MREYLDLVEHLYGQAIHAPESIRRDRTGVGTFGIFGHTMRFDLGEGFPLLTAKRTHWDSVLGELLWFISGSGNNLDLRSRGVRIWDEWAHPITGDLGPIYGVQWRSWIGFDHTEHDQLESLIEGLRSDPMGRRHIVSAWNVSDLRLMALPPCHYSFQMYVDGADRLSMLVNMRSSDVFLGLPFNIASYAALTHIVAAITDYDVGDLVMNLGDTHLYANHVQAAGQLLEQASGGYPGLPELLVDRDLESIDEVTEDHIKLIGYEHLGQISAPVAV